MKAIKMTGQMGVTVVKKTGEAGVTIAHEVEDAVQSNYRRLQTTVGRRKNRTNKSLIESDEDDYDNENDAYGSSHTLSPRASKSILSNLNSRNEQLSPGLKRLATLRRSDSIGKNI